jgi:hypothetical protein
MRASLHRSKARREAYPDEMIAASSAATRRAEGTSDWNCCSGCAAGRPWWQQAFGKIADKPKDAQGNLTGKPSPYENIAAAFEKGPERMKALEEDQAPEQVKDFTGTAPPARNVSPGLANIQQTWGNTLNSYLQPLTWSRAPPGAPQMAQAGPQGAAALPVPGVSLNSVQPFAYGVGYGVNPVGYGFG